MCRNKTKHNQNGLCERVRVRECVSGKQCNNWYGIGLEAPPHKPKEEENNNKSSDTQ